MKKLLIATCIISFGLWSCKEDDKPVIKTLCDSVTYNTMVKPVLTLHCNVPGCHSSGAGGVDLRKYDNVVDAAKNKEMVKAINHQLDSNRNMPQGAAKLSQRNINIIECWINKGYPE